MKWLEQGQPFGHGTQGGTKFEKEKNRTYNSIGRTFLVHPFGRLGRQIVHSDLSFLYGRLGHSLNFLPLRSCQYSIAGDGLDGKLWATRQHKHTMEAILEKSLSAVTTTDRTKNLSLHRVSRGGSSFIPWRRTRSSDILAQTSVRERT